VLDSFALIGYLENEPFAQTMERILFTKVMVIDSSALIAVLLGEPDAKVYSEAIAKPRREW
jgi:hypothetical protein